MSSKPLCTRHTLGHFSLLVNLPKSTAHDLACDAYYARQLFLSHDPEAWPTYIEAPGYCTRRRAKRLRTPVNLQPKRDKKWENVSRERWPWLQGRPREAARLRP